MCIYIYTHTFFCQPWNNLNETCVFGNHHFLVGYSQLKLYVWMGKIFQELVHRKVGEVVPGGWWCCNFVDIVDINVKVT